MVVHILLYTKLKSVNKFPEFEWHNVTFDNIENRCNLIPK